MTTHVAEIHGAEAEERALAMKRAQPAKWWAATETGLIALGLGALLVLLTYSLHGDGAERYTELTRLLSGQGMAQGKYSLVGPLFSAPLYVVGALFGDPRGWTVRYDWLVLAVGIGGAWLALRNRVERRLLRTFFLLLIAGSMFPYHLMSYYGETFTAICVGFGLLFAMCGPRRTGWVLIVLGVANTPATLPALALVVGKRMLETRSARPILALATAVALILGENWLQWGSPLSNGYRTDPGWTMPVLFGLLAILFSFGKGLIFYVPGVFLPVRRALLAGGIQRGRELYAAHTSWLVFGAGLVVVYAHWWAWYGGWYWGPRFFLILSLPASLALAARLRAPAATIAGNLVTLFVLMLSVWVDVDGAVFGQQTLGPICQANNYAHEYFCHYLPQYSALWRPFLVAEPLTLQNILYMAYVALVFAYLAAPLMLVLARQARQRRPRGGVAAIK